jgi:hypothetical protein
LTWQKWWKPWPFPLSAGTKSRDASIGETRTASRSSTRKNVNSGADVFSVRLQGYEDVYDTGYDFMQDLHVSQIRVKFFSRHKLQPFFYKLEKKRNDN